MPFWAITTWTFMTWISWGRIIWSWCERSSMYEDILWLRLIMKHHSECDNFFPYKSCNFQCHPSGGWHCSVGSSLMQLSAKKDWFLRVIKFKRLNKMQKKKRGERKSFRVFVKPSLAHLDVVRVRPIFFTVPQDKRGLW